MWRRATPNDYPSGLGGTGRSQIFPQSGQYSVCFSADNSVWTVRVEWHCGQGTC